ncbi:MAG TPA: aminotransferase class I/II-fold pyridoxal phosphate-dependent enzyme [Spirochaetia bacterium]
MHRTGGHGTGVHGSSKLHWFLPDAFGFIRELTATPPKCGERLINLSIGAPNRPTPEAIRMVMKEAVDVTAYHTYPPQFGAPELCAEVAAWYKRRFGVAVDAKREVLVTVGIKEAIFNSLHALVNPGDVILVPNPGYPTYFEAVTFCGGKMVDYDSNQDQEETLTSIRRAAEIHTPSYVIVNYPSNPTGRVVTADFYRGLSELSHSLGFAVLSDLAYSEIAFDGFRVPSYFEARGNPSNALEYFAFSKTYNMAGWRVGAIVADEAILGPVKLYKSKIDSNVFYPIQLAAAHGLRTTSESFYAELARIYEERRDILVEGLKSDGLTAVTPRGAMYAWVHVPTGLDSWQFTRRLYDDCGILGVPGVGYGSNGRDYVRLGLVQEKEIMKTAADRLRSGVTGR